MALTRITKGVIKPNENYDTHNINSTGIITATKFVGQADISGGSIVGTSATFTGNVSIGGTLTYEDVTNIDAVGLITARSGIKVLAGGANIVGVTTIIKGTSGGATANTDAALIVDNSSHTYVQFRTPATKEQGLLFGDDADNDAGAITYSHSTNHLGFRVNATERARIDSSGRLSFAGDTDTYIWHPQANQLAVTIGGGSRPMIRFGTGGGGSTVGFSTNANLVTNGEIVSVRGYSSFKSVNKDYAALYTHNEGGNGSGEKVVHQYFHWSGASRAGFGVETDNSTLIMNNNGNISFRTGNTGLSGTERLLVQNAGAKVTGTLELTDSLYWDGDTNTTIDNAGGTADFIRFKTGGTTVMDIDADQHVKIHDNRRLRIGASNDIQIFHNSGNNRNYYFSPQNDVYHEFAVSNSWAVQTTAGDKRILCPANGTSTAVELYHNGSKKLETTSLGARVVGDLQMGNTAGVRFHHTGTTSIFETQTAADSLLFKTTPSGGSTTERLRISSTGQIHLNGASSSTTGTSITDLLMANGAAIRFRKHDGMSWINTVGLDNSNNLKLGWGGAVDEIHFGISGIGEQMMLRSTGDLIIGNGGTNFGNAAVQSFSAHGSTAGESGFSSVDTTSVGAGVGGEIAFHGKYNTGAQDYAYFGHIRGAKENATAGDTACALKFFTRPNATAPIERLRIDSNGRVRLGGDVAGTTVTNLDVTNGRSTITDCMLIKGNTGNGFIRFQDNDSTCNWTMGADDGSGIGANGFIWYDRVNSAYRLSIDNDGDLRVWSGKLGVGVDPTEKLHVQHNHNGHTRAVIQNNWGANATAQLKLVAPTDELQIVKYASGSAAINLSNNSTIIMNIGGAERLKIRGESTGQTTHIVNTPSPGGNGVQSQHVNQPYGMSGNYTNFRVTVSASGWHSFFLKMYVSGYSGDAAYRWVTGYCNNGFGTIRHVHSYDGGDFGSGSITHISGQSWRYDLSVNSGHVTHPIMHVELSVAGNGTVLASGAVVCAIT